MENAPPFSAGFFNVTELATGLIYDIIQQARWGDEEMGGGAEAGGHWLVYCDMHRRRDLARDFS